MATVIIDTICFVGKRNNAGISILKFLMLNVKLSLINIKSSIWLHSSDNFVTGSIIHFQLFEKQSLDRLIQKIMRWNKM